MCPLRFLFARVPHLRSLGTGNGFAARPHLLNEARRRRRCPNDSQVGQPLRRLPRVHGLHDSVPFRRGLRQAHRSYPRANRAPFPPLSFREAPSPVFVRNFHAARSFAPFARAAPRLSEIWLASHRSRLGLCQTASEKMASNGSAAFATRSPRSRRGSHSGRRRKAAARWLASWLRAARIL